MKKTEEITLISPDSRIQSFGVRTLSSCLKKEGYKVKIIFITSPLGTTYSDEMLDGVINICKGSAFVGISVMTNFFSNAVQITERIKETLDMPIIWGGIHPTIRPLECLNHADIVCIGEGEEAIVEFANKIHTSHEIKNIWFNDNGKITKNNLRPLIQNLDSLPFQDYDYETHYILDKSIRRMNINLLKNYTKKIYMTISTRGCPFGCTYCCNNTLNRMYPNQNIIRKRSIDNLIDELKLAKKRLPFIEEMMFGDDAFFFYTADEIKDFSEKYKEDVGLPLIINGATPTTLTREKFLPLVEAGLKEIRVGIQSGSEYTRKLYRRSYSNHRIEEIVRMMEEFKGQIKPPRYDIILDNPWESDDNLRETLIMLSKFLPPFCLSLFSLTFYPETELYEKAKREGIIIDDLKEIYHKHYTKDIRKTYFNKLFFLLKYSGESGQKISERTMSLLTNKKLISLKLNWMLYCILYIKTIGGFKIQRVNHLLTELSKDIKENNWFRITGYLK